MPPTISVAVRASIARVLGERFADAEDMDSWLHARHEALDGDTPFERVVDGDGLTVLLALIDPHGRLDPLGQSVCARSAIHSHLKLMEYPR
jgi:hypothetical protein